MNKDVLYRIEANAEQEYRDYFGEQSDREPEIIAVFIDCAKFGYALALREKEQFKNENLKDVGRVEKYREALEHIADSGGWMGTTDCEINGCYANKYARQALEALEDEKI